jgi:transposase-like protein
MTRIVNQKRYSEEFKRKVMEEVRQGKWGTPYAAAKAYGVRPITISAWMDAAGLSHLRGRTVEVKTLSEVSELHKLRKENRRLREQLLDEILSHRADVKTLEVAGREFGFAVASYRAKALNDVAVIRPESV